ncbi:MAG: EAL domain-containing protein [Pseudomonadota bacterium]
MKDKSDNKGLGIDPIQGYQEKLETIKKRLLEYDGIGLILIDASSILRINKEFGKKVYNEVLQALRDIISDMKGKLIREDDIVTVKHPPDDQFYIFLAKKREDKEFRCGDLENLADRLTTDINKAMFMVVFPLLKRGTNISVGYAFTIRNALIKEERLLQKLIEDAKIMVGHQQLKHIMRKKRELQDLILKKEIETVYQPIVNMTSHETIGYEALSRGPEATQYKSPYVLFSIAEETGLLFELDYLCRRKALSNANGINPGMGLFVNILPASIYTPELKESYLDSFLQAIDTEDGTVILELSEKEALEDYPILKNATKHLKNVEWAITINDTEASYSNFESILQLAPDYIKLDISMVHDIEKNDLKREFVKTIVQIAANIKTKVIAEGIERKKQSQALIDIGIIYGQGFLFAEPGLPFPKPQFV